MAEAFGLMSQLNDLFDTQSFLGIQNNSLLATINLSLSAASPLAAINHNLFSAYGLGSPNGCLDWTSEAVTVDLEDVPFACLQCAYFTLEEDEILPGTIFEPTRDLIDRTQSCQQRFGITPPDFVDLSARFHFTFEEVVNSQRIIFSSGTYDPTTGACAQPDWFKRFNPDRNASFAQITSGLPHTLELLMETRVDPPQVIVVRLASRATLSVWFTESFQF